MARGQRYTPIKAGHSDTSVTPDAELRILADLRNSVASPSSPKPALVGGLVSKIRRSWVPELAQ